MATATPPPILDFTTERTRLTVAIDGIAYEMRDENDLTLANYRLLQQAGPRLSELEDLPRMTPAQEAEYADLLKSICELALDAPERVIARTGIVQRIALVRGFCELSAPSLRKLGATMQAPAPQPPFPGTNSSPGSSASTGAPTRRAGSRRSR